MVYRSASILVAAVALLALPSAASAEVPAGEAMSTMVPAWQVLLRLVLLGIFFVALVASFHAPGTGVPEAAAATSLALLLLVPALAGHAAWYEIAIVLVGVFLLILELFVIPGTGAAGIAGVALVVGGLTMAFLSPLVGDGGDLRRLTLNLLTVIGGIALGGLMWMIVGRLVPKLPAGSGLILNDVEPTEEERARQIPWPEVGALGRAVTDLRPGGTARFAVTPAPDDTATADVVSDRGFVAAGTPVRVIEAAGSRVVVRPAEGVG